MKVPATKLRPIAVAVIIFVSYEAWAQSDKFYKDDSDASSSLLPTVEVTAESIDNRVYSRDEIDATAGGNRDIAKLLESHPAVRLNPLAKNANKGSLAVEDFSIHGESPYQNQFMIDGISGVNIISPHEKEGSLQNGKVVGFSQSYNIDTDVLESVEVLDNRVPIEFGRFQGGVVNAKIKNPIGSNSFSVKQGFNSSGLTEQQVAKNLNSDWESGKPGYAAQWRKSFSSFNGDVRVSERSSALLSYSRRESLIFRKARKLDLSLPDPVLGDAYYVSEQEKDNVDNLMLKFRTKWDASTSSNFLLKYADRKEDLVGASGQNTNEDWTNRQSARGLAFELEKEINLGNWTLNVGLDDLDSAREADSYERVTQQYFNLPSGTSTNSSKTYQTGSFGDEALKQRQYVVKSRLGLKPFKTGVLQHSLYLGFEWQQTQAGFERKRDVHTHTYIKRPNGNQEHRYHHIYKAGDFDVDYSSLALYVSDTVQWKDISLGVAARVDEDNFLKNTNVSPRARIDWNVAGRDQTNFGLGWSRYYGLDIIGYAIEDGQDRLLYHVIHDYVSINEFTSPKDSRFNGLKTPSSDEFVASVGHKISEYFMADLSYVKRKSKNEVTRGGSAANGWRYENGGSGTTETLVLSLKSINPLNFAGAKWNTRVDYSQQKNNRSQDSTLGWTSKGFLPDDIITVDGVKMQRKDKPAGELTQPERISLGLTGIWNSVGLTWGNRFNWMGAKKELVSLNTNYNNFKTYKIPGYLTWDTRITYKPNYMRGVSLNVDVLNVLNEMPVIATTATTLLSTPRFATGREIWLNIEYNF